MYFRTCQENARGENPISLKFSEVNCNIHWVKHLPVLKETKCEAEQNTAQSCLAADNEGQYHWAAESQDKITSASLEQFHYMSNYCHCLASVPFKDGEKNYN